MGDGETRGIVKWAKWSVIVGNCHTSTFTTRSARGRGGDKLGEVQSYGPRGELWERSSGDEGEGKRGRDGGKRGKIRWNYSLKSTIKRARGNFSP